MPFVFLLCETTFLPNYNSLCTYGRSRLNWNEGPVSFFDAQSWQTLKERAFFSNLDKNCSTKTPSESGIVCLSSYYSWFCCYLSEDNKRTIEVSCQMKWPRLGSKNGRPDRNLSDRRASTGSCANAAAITKPTSQERASQRTSTCHSSSTTITSGGPNPDIMPKLQ
jgi:hypothetical protein